MASNQRTLWGVGLIAGAVAGTLLLVHFTRKPALRTTVVDIQRASPSASAARDPGSAERAAPRAAKPDAALAPGDPEPASGAALATEEVRAKDASGIGPQLPVARQWKLEAQQKQLALYRAQIDVNVRALDKLGQTIERLKREGATAEQVEQIQSRLRQMREADTRMRLHLQQLEQELAEKIR
jgi:hypothetical protein